MMIVICLNYRPLVLPSMWVWVKQTIACPYFSGSISQPSTHSEETLQGILILMTYSIRFPYCLEKIQFNLIKSNWNILVAKRAILIPYHLVESQLVKCLGWKSITHIPSPNSAPIHSIDGNIKVLTFWPTEITIMCQLNDIRPIDFGANDSALFWWNLNTLFYLN